MGWIKFPLAAVMLFAPPTPVSLTPPPLNPGSTTAPPSSSSKMLLVSERFMYLVNSWSPALPRGLRDFIFFPCLYHIHQAAFNLLCIFQSSKLGIEFIARRPAMLNWVPSLFSRRSQQCNCYCFLLIYLFLCLSVLLSPKAWYADPHMACDS